MARIYVALDLETTGLDSRRDTIIEVGALRFKGDQILDEFQSLVNPGRPIPYLVQHLTGIGNKDVRNAPPFSAIRSGLLRFVGNSPIIGHNIQFDLSFLKNHGLFEQNPSIDTFELASILLPHAERYSLQSLAMLLGVQEPPTHRALDDARVTHRLFESLLDQARRLDSRIIENVSKMAAKSKWSLAPVFQDLNRERSTQFAGSPFGQLLSTNVQDILVEDAPPLEPGFPPSRLDIHTLAAQIEPGGLIEKAFPGFEHRPQQVAMLKAVADAFNEAYHLIVEAGTGTGKSMAYLLPAIQWAITNNQRVVISTNTINLQDQLLNKDLPDLKKALNLNLRATALKGRGNYVCQWRVEQMRRKENLSPVEMRLLAKIMVWMPNTTTGDKQELFIPNYAEQALWHQVNANAEICPPDRCAREGCFFSRARHAAESAHIIVVNHALLLSDIAVNNRVIPEYTYLVIDEAHHLEDSITNQLGFSINKSSLAQLLTDLTHRKNSLFAQIASRIKQAKLVNLQADAEALAKAGAQRAEDAQSAWYTLFDTLDSFVMDYSPQARTQYDRRLRLSSNMRTQPAWSDVEISWDNAATTLSGLQKLMKQVGKLWDGLDSYDVDKWEETMLVITDFRTRLEEVTQHMNLIFAQDDDNIITWLEQKAQTQDVSAHAAPLHVGNLVREHLLEAKESVVFTSATMRTDNSFEYLKERLSAWDVSELAVGSPFDYAASTMVFTPTDIPEPAHNGFQKAFEDGLSALLVATQGRTLVLFTSYNHLRTTARNIRKTLTNHGIVLYQQGSGASRRQLLDNFKKADKAVLLGTRSFWEGIDIPGPALSCVVIAKIPFAVPSDPIVQARSETFDDSFSQYSIPEAILHFRQGFGRLIRTQSDKGVVVIMDKRVLSKGYGHEFLNSLPDATLEQGSISDLPHLAANWIDADEAS